jgi:SAM-dependent methyltransferase
LALLMEAPLSLAPVRLPRHHDVMRETVSAIEEKPAAHSAMGRVPVETGHVASLQGAHYDRLIELYEAHATDPSTQRYRRRFIDEPLLRGIDLDGRTVLEAMCGSGHSTGLLLERGARVTGLDVSVQAIELFKSKWPRCDAVVESILAPTLADGSFDVVVVVGGLHHVHPHAGDAIARIWRLLRPGGFFCFSEPHAGSLVDLARRAWYARDPMFESNEAAVDIDALRLAAAPMFDVVSERYFGNVAHTLVLNSMVIRAPSWLKRLYAAPAMALEGVLNPVLGRRLSCSVSCQWQKRA